MAMTSDAAALLFSAFDLVLLSIIVGELIIHGKYNGPILRGIVAVMIGVVCILIFPMLARIDLMLDISPGWSLHAALSASVWAAYACLTPLLMYLWWALHTEHARRKGGP
jgi:hypothetical protein